MKLNHLSLAVPDVTATAAFMQNYFGFKNTNSKDNNKMAVLEGLGNFIVVLTTWKQGDGVYPADFHFGFLLNTEADVSAFYDRLIEDGYDVPRAPAKIRNSLAFYFRIPGDIMVEVGVI